MIMEISGGFFYVRGLSTVSRILSVCSQMIKKYNQMNKIVKIKFCIFTKNKNYVIINYAG